MANDLLNDVWEAFLRNEIELKNEWLQATCDFLQEERTPTEEFVQRVFFQWAHADLRLTTNPTFKQPTFVCTQRVVLQLISIADISTSRRQQSKDSDLSIQTAKEGAPFEQLKVPHRRMLRLVLSDGARQVVAVEHQPCPELSAQMRPGCKIALVANVRCQSGILLLTDKCVQVLGGVVAELVDAAAEVENQLPPIVRQPGGAPPPAAASVPIGFPPRPPPPAAPIQAIPPAASFSVSATAISTQSTATAPRNVLKPAPLPLTTSGFFRPAAPLVVPRAAVPAAPAAPTFVPSQRPAAPVRPTSATAFSAALGQVVTNPIDQNTCFSSLLTAKKPRARKSEDAASVKKEPAVKREPKAPRGRKAAATSSRGSATPSTSFTDVSMHTVGEDSFLNDDYSLHSVGFDAPGPSSSFVPPSTSFVSPSSSTFAPVPPSFASPLAQSIAPTASFVPPPAATPVITIGSQVKDKPLDEMSFCWQTATQQPYRAPLPSASNQPPSFGVPPWECSPSRHVPETKRPRLSATNENITSILDSSQHFRMDDDEMETEVQRPDFFSQHPFEADGQSMASASTGTLPSLQPPVEKENRPRIVEKFVQLDFKTIKQAQEYVKYRMNKYTFNFTGCIWKFASELRVEDGEWQLRVLFDDFHSEQLECQMCPQLLVDVIGMTPTEAEACKKSDNKAKRRTCLERMTVASDNMMRLDLAFQIVFHSRLTPVIVKMETLMERLMDN